MKELKADLFKLIYQNDIDAICITTNQQYSKLGIAAMSGGCALVCAQRWPQTAKNLGQKLKTFGINVPFIIGAVDKEGEYLEINREMIKNKQFKCLIFSFPTINNIGDGANIQLIKQSATILKDYANQFDLNGIVLGRPGAGIAGGIWTEIKAAIEPIFDDRFTIVSFEHED